MAARRRTPVTIALTAVVLAGPVACSNRAAPTLVFQLDPHPLDRATLTFPVAANRFSIETGSFLCSTRPVHITSVELYGASAGIRLIDWGLANHPFSKSVTIPHPGPLLGLEPFTSHSVTARCHHTQWYARVGLELLRTKPGTQHVRAVRVTYSSAGLQRGGYISEQYVIRDPGPTGARPPR